MQTEELKERIAALPASLQEALERQARAYITIARLDAVITKVEAEIEKQEENDDDPDDDALAAPAQKQHTGDPAREKNVERKIRTRSGFLYFSLYIFLSGWS